MSSSFSSSSSPDSEASDQTRTKQAPDERDPNAEKLKYFHHRIHRVDVIPMLRRNGDFIVRRMFQGTKEKYVVSVRWEGLVKHFPVQQSKERYCFEAKRFRQMRDLIDFYMNSMSLTMNVERQPWEFLSRQIETKKQIERRNFGIVFEATLTSMAGGRHERSGSQSGRGQDRSDPCRDARRSENEAFGVTTDQKTPVAVMELVNGGSLDQILRKDSLPMDTKLRLAWEAAAGVKYIHTQGCLHRDFALSNCLIEKQIASKFGPLKITDFGLAKYVGDKVVFKAKSVTQMPIAWSAIESLEEFVWTAESDIWSLGVLICEIIFDRQTTIRHLREGRGLDFPEKVQQTVVDAIRQCWESMPSERPVPTGNETEVIIV